MGQLRWSPVVGFWLVLGVSVSSTAQTTISARWLGQDGYDFCGAKADAIQPNGYQDVHIALNGLPRDREIVAAKIRGFGSGEWQYKAPNAYGFVIERKPGSGRADLFFEPDRVETGRGFNVTLTFNGGAEVNVDIGGGKADPNLRMPASGMSARWVGQERTDHTGQGPGVGPDNLQDVRITLANLTPRERVTSVLVTDGARARWAFGINHEGHHNAEFLRDEKDPTRGNLYLQPDRDLAGHRLKVSVTYDTNKTDSAEVVAGRCDPKLAMTKAPLPRLGALTVSSRWLGQDGSPGTSRGDVHIGLSGLPARRIVAAVLSDAVRGVWVYRAGDVPSLDVEDGSAPLDVRAKGTTADLFFAPIRDEAGSSLTLRLVFADGDSAVATIPGGTCDPAKRAPETDKTEAVAKPGDDLNAVLAGRAGTVRLTKGEYRLSRPLVLDRPVTIVGEAGAVLTFAQPPADPPWTAAIKVHAGNTTLRGFGVRFAGPVRWRTDVSWGPAVIGTTDNFDTGPNAPKFNLVFDSLDIEGPPSTGKVPWEEAVKLMRLNFAPCGRVTNNVLKGGLIELFGGPWQVVGNDYRGTPSGTYAYSVFAAHDPYDLLLKKNKAKPVGAGGKVWRFLVLTGRGTFDRVEDNVVERVGPRDDDTMTGYNSPEIVLTESYHLCFEGKPAAVSADGRLVKVGPLRGMAPKTGDVVSVVSGPGAGQWRRIAQRVEPTVFYLDAPLPKGSDVVLVSPGFVDDVYSGNTVDARDGRGAGCLVLAGNHFGTKVVDNRFIGAGDAFRLVAFPSETPNHWGWSHVPFFGGLVEGNVIEDSERGGSVGVDHGPAVKANKGRVYMTVTLKNNIVRWTQPFLTRLKNGPRPPAGITLGIPGSFDSGELVVTESGDRLEAPPRTPSASAMVVNAAMLNGRPYTNRAFPLGGASASTSSAKAREKTSGR